MQGGDRTDELPRAADLAQGRVAGARMSFAPYWWDAAPRRGDPPPPIPSKADVVIVGSGYAGLSAALTLARRSRQPIVLDSNVPGFGASTRNGGQIGSGAQKFTISTLMKLRGRDKALALLHESLRMLEHLETLIASEGIECHFRRCGRFRCAVRPEHYESMAREMDEQRRVLGVESFMVPKGEMRREIATDVFHGGSVLPNDGGLHPGLFHSGLMQRVVESGGSVIGSTAVTAIVKNANGFRVSTPAGDIECREIVVTTNGYTDGPVPWLERRIVPVGSSLIATSEIPPETLARLMPTGRVYGTTFRLYSYYRIAPDAPRLLWGGRIGRFAAADSPGAYSHLAAGMLRVFPELGDVRITHAWQGYMGYTYDEVPHLGRTADGLHYALGCNGTAGITRSVYFGHKVALKVLGDPEGATSWDDLDFPAYPAAFVARRMVPVAEGWYALRDAYNF